MDPKRKKLVLQYIITITKAKKGEFHICASKLVCECVFLRGTYLRVRKGNIAASAVLTEKL